MGNRRRRRKAGSKTSREGRPRRGIVDKPSNGTFRDAMRVAGHLARLGFVLEQHDAPARAARAVVNTVKAILDLAGL